MDDDRKILVEVVLVIAMVVLQLKTILYFENMPDPISRQTN